MSGTSVDGIDAALVHCVPSTGDPDGVLQLHVEHHAEFPWPDDLRNRLLGAVAPAQVGVAELCALDQLVGIEFARVVRESATWGPCDLVASHGQTLHHAVGADGRVSGTLQIGEPAWIAATVKGHRFLPGGGHETCPVMDTRIARWWPWDLPKGWPPPRL